MSFARTPLYRIIKVTQHCLHAAIRRSFKADDREEMAFICAQRVDDLVLWTWPYTRRPLI
ncbi:hypothetical protein K443DRAFT_683023 [Laccaria amethystina LaAM-08-1]|uniref:Uncharacterized protein n=1 Tax=Laccaria amethystina LaAM-08-1 TaxID=1095629 RepID=A0A0C9WTT3_9AGAR|nr:hypothetical protein K443DRAFT_683023 [Laccaria amethystina LaAM-08-1]